MNLSKRLMPEYIRLSSWLMIFMFFLFPLKNILSQDKVYNAPDVSIFSEPEQVFELPGAGDYIGPERLQKYNFSNINDILREMVEGIKKFTGGKNIHLSPHTWTYLFTSLP